MYVVLASKSFFICTIWSFSPSNASLSSYAYSDLSKRSLSIRLSSTNLLLSAWANYSYVVIFRRFDEVYYWYMSLSYLRVETSSLRRVQSDCLSYSLISNYLLSVSNVSLSLNNRDTSCWCRRVMLLILPDTSVTTLLFSSCSSKNLTSFSSVDSFSLIKSTWACKRVTTAS